MIRKQGSDNLIACFGFWTHLLTAEYEEPRKLSLLWPHLTAEVFPSRPAQIRWHHLENKFTRIRDLRNRLAHHEAVWKFQELDANGKPDYSRPVYGLNASLHLLRRAWDDILEALYWICPVRYAAFMSEGHHVRFETLATLEGLKCYTECDNSTHGPPILKALLPMLLVAEARKRFASYWGCDQGLMWPSCVPTIYRMKNTLRVSFTPNALSVST